SLSVMSSTAQTLEKPPQDDAGGSSSQSNGMRRRGRRIGGGASLVAQGEPMVWLTGGALVIALTMIVGLLVYVFFQGTRTFWPSPLVQVQLADGSVFLGEVTREEHHRIDEHALEELPAEAAEAARREMAESD